MSQRFLFLGALKTVVDSSLEGLVRSNPRLKLLQKERVVIRADIVSGN